MHTEPRGTHPIRVIVIHTNESAEATTTAAGLAEYLKTIPGGYHKICDNASTVTCATDDQVVWGASGANDTGLHVCLIGFANQTDQQWHDNYSTSELKRAAQVVAAWCLRYHIPVRRLSPAQLRVGSLGIVGHVDVTAAFGGNNDGHADPGEHFPWTEFLSLVAQGVTPPEKVRPMYDPPITVVGGIAASCENPGGGSWLVGAQGHVYTLNGAPYLGAPHGQSYWGDRKAAKIKAKNYGNALVRRWGYQIWATTGEGPYDFRP